jgi:hypothetical protein
MTARILDPQTCERIVKLLGMAGSKHDGEVVNAARAADRLLRARGLCWDDVICVPCLEPGPPPDPDPAHFDFDFDDLDWTDAVGLCLARRHELRPRDRHFVESLNEWCGTPTSRQLAWLKDIFERLGGRA